MCCHLRSGHKVATEDHWGSPVQALSLQIPKEPWQPGCGHGRRGSARVSEVHVSTCVRSCALCGQGVLLCAHVHTYVWAGVVGACV